MEPVLKAPSREDQQDNPGRCRRRAAPDRWREMCRVTMVSTGLRCALRIQDPLRVVGSAVSRRRRSSTKVAIAAVRQISDLRQMRRH